MLLLFSLAKASMVNQFGEGVEKIMRIYLTVRIGMVAWLSPSEEIKYRKQCAQLSLPCEKQGWLSLSITDGSGMSWIF